MELSLDLDNSSSIDGTEKKQTYKYTFCNCIYIIIFAHPVSDTNGNHDKVGVKTTSCFQVLSRWAVFSPFYVYSSVITVKYRMYLSREHYSTVQRMSNKEEKQQQ